MPCNNHLAAVASMSLLAARWGARLTHRPPVVSHQRVFAGLLYLLALHMAWGVWDRLGG